jgi:tRNA-splicing ligase RtcB
MRLPSLVPSILRASTSSHQISIYGLALSSKRLHPFGREATGGVDRKTGEVKHAGKVTPEMMRALVARAGIELCGGGLDESPDCYERLDEVLEAVGDTVRILHRLTPVGVPMAGANKFDPYKD